MEKEITLIEAIKCDLSVGEMILVPELAQWSDDPCELQEAISFLQRQEALGFIVRVYPRELYVATETISRWIKNNCIVWVGDRLFEVFDR